MYLKQNYKLLLLILIFSFTGCITIVPELKEYTYDSSKVDFKGNVYIEFIDNHTIMNDKAYQSDIERNILPGEKRELDESKFKPDPFIDFYRKNIIENIENIPRVKLVYRKNEADYYIKINLNNFSAKRDLPGWHLIYYLPMTGYGLYGCMSIYSATGCFTIAYILFLSYYNLIVLPPTYIFFKEYYIAEVSLDINIEKINKNKIINTAAFNVSEKTEARHSKTFSLKRGYDEVIQPLMEKSIAKIIEGIGKCN